MISMVMVTKIQKGREAEFEAGITEMFRLTKSEPGCLGCFWGRTDVPGEYAAWERYRDMAAFDAHRATDHVKFKGPPLMALFDGEPHIAHFEEH